MSEEKRHQVVALGQLGWTLRRIQEATGIRRETASKYLKQAGILIRRGRRPLTSGPPKPAIIVSADSGLDSKAAIIASPEPNHEKPAIFGRPSKGEAHREFIEEAIGLGRHAKSIWQDLVDDHGFSGSYACVKRFIVKIRGQQIPEAHPIIVTEPGEEGQVDYGDGPMVRQSAGEKYHRTRLFVFTLGCSRKSARFLVFRSSSRTWADLHERSFVKLGGAPRVVVLDNLREGVLKPDVYDPEINPLYRDLLKHYGVIALPCRVRDPNRKGKVESGVAHAQKKLKGLRFESLEDAQAYLDHWEQTWADTRIHGTTKRQVLAMFEEEKPHLLPLPLEPFRFYEHGIRVVHLDGCIEVCAAYYGVPATVRCGSEVKVQWDETWVRILDLKSGQLLREHLRQKRGRHRVDPRDRPKKTPDSTEKILERAQRAGQNIGLICRAIYRDDREIGVRKILGVLSLVKKYGAHQTDVACLSALEVGSPNYRFVKKYLERNLGPPLSLKQIDPLIRELAHYKELIEKRTEGETV